MHTDDVNDDQGGGGMIGSTSDYKPGQRYPTPSPGNGQRVFYETLLQQNANSEMAQDWCLAYGVLDHDKTINLYKLSMKRKNKEIDTAALKEFSAKAYSPVPKKEGGSK